MARENHETGRPRPRRNAEWARWTLAKMHREDKHIQNVRVGVEKGLFQGLQGDQVAHASKPLKPLKCFSKAFLKVR